MMSASLNQTPYQYTPSFFNPHQTLGMQHQNNEPIQAMNNNNTAANLNADPNVALTYLTFLEQKIGHLRTIISSDTNNHQLPQQQQLVTTEVNCIIFQLISISKNLLPCTTLAVLAKDDQEYKDSSSWDPHEPADSDHIEELDIDEDEHDLLPGSYEVHQIEKEDILAPHTHLCSVCGRGFKRDANLRMHMRGHGDEYKTASALAKPGREFPAASNNGIKKRYSCPFVGCRRNKEHKSFQPLKTALCVKNHYKRSHCDKSYTCSRCHVKKFSVTADLRTHEKHCGRDKWVCSCGTTFSRKDKLFGHVTVFEGHTPALPPEEDLMDSSNLVIEQVQCRSSSGGGSAEEVKKLLSLDCVLSESLFDDDDDIKDVVSIKDMDDGCGYFSPMGIDSFSFDGFGLFQDLVM